MAISEAAKARQMQLGGGGRFKKLAGTLKRKGVEDPAALAAWIGRRKYGAKRFAALGAAGRKK